MKQGKLISVVIPIYNVENYIAYTITSIMNQTYKNLEIILVNDGSTDSSADICNEYALKDERIKIVNKKNGGLSDARNCGAAAATGEYIVFIDGDDAANAEMIERLYQALVQNDADVAMCSFQKVSESELGSMVQDKVIIPQGESQVYSSDEAIGMLFKENIYVTFTVAWNKLYKKSIFQTIQYPIGKIHEDEFVAYRIFDSIKKLVYIDEPLYYYTQRDTSIMGTPFSVRRYHKVEAHKERLLYMIEHNKFVSKAMLNYMWNYLKYIYDYRQSEIYDEQTYKKYKKDIKRECKAYRKCISKKDYIKTRMKIVAPSLYRNIKRSKSQG